MLEKNKGNSVCLDQNGRSMVEMLGSLAIMGVLSAGAIGGYSYAMNKHRTNELIYEATKRAQWVGTQLEMNNPNPSLNTFGTDSFGGGRFTGEVVQLENGQIGIKVAGLKEAVCQNILNSIGDNTVIREMKDVNCNDDNGTATLVFNRDLSPSDPTEIPEVSGEASGPASTASEVTATEASDRKLHCNDHGDWDGSSCDCDAGYEGETCSVEINAQPDEPEATATATAYGPCGSHGDWIYNTASHEGYCSCATDWAGDDCSLNTRETYCNNHGSWNGSSCTCDSTYTGTNCATKMDTSCNGHGTWNGSRCTCDDDSDWIGGDCTCSGRAYYCNGNGTWNKSSGTCQCDMGWYGYACETQDVRVACNNEGTWTGTGCECDPGVHCWAGWARPRPPASCL